MGCVPPPVNYGFSLRSVEKADLDRLAPFGDAGQRLAELNASRKRLARSDTLAREGATSAQERDDDSAQVEGSAAAVEAATAAAKMHAASTSAAMEGVEAAALGMIMHDLAALHAA